MNNPSLGVHAICIDYYIASCHQSAYSYSYMHTLLHDMHTETTGPHIMLDFEEGKLAVFTDL